jgi:hypothetical protein
MGPQSQMFGKTEADWKAYLHWRDQRFASFPRETHGHNANSFRSWLLEAGYEIAWDLVTQDEMLTASVASFHRGSSEAFATILNKIIRPVR